MEIRSQTPGILKFFKFSDFIRSALLLRFQRALNHTPKFFLTQVIPSFLYFKNTIVWLVAYFENKISTLFFFMFFTRTRFLQLFESYLRYKNNTQKFKIQQNMLRFARARFARSRFSFAMRGLKYKNANFYFTRNSI